MPIFDTLIVDDNVGRANRISKIVQSSCGETCGSITIVNSAASAIKRLLQAPCDLLIVDIALPSIDNGSPLPDGGQILLDQLHQLGSAVATPSWVIAITSHEASRELTKISFRESLVWVLFDAPGVNEWEGQLKVFCTRISTSTRYDNSSSDICFVTALRTPELEAVLDLKFDWKSRGVTNFLSSHYAGTLAHKGRVASVSAFTYDKMGLVPMSYLVGNVINEFRPKVVFLTGICAGIGKDVALGDIIIAESSWNWQAGKVGAGATALHEPDIIQASARLVALARLAASDLHLGQSLLKAGQYTSIKDRVPSMHVGPMASGSVVLADAAAVEKVTVQHRKAIGLDMEAYGCYAASRYAGHLRTEIICLKGVSDNATASKADNLQMLGAIRSALVAEQIAKLYVEGGTIGSVS